MTLLAPGDWRPAAAGPALLILQLVGALQAALRGLDYWRNTGPTPPALAAVEGAAPPQVWAGLLCGSAAVVLLGMAVRRAAVIVLGHLLIGAVYLGLGVPVLASAARGPAWLAAAALLTGAAGTYALTRDRSRLLSGLLGGAAMVAAAVILSGTLGPDYRTGTALAAAGIMHGALALGVGVTATRRRLVAQLEEEVRA